MIVVSVDVNGAAHARAAIHPVAAVAMITRGAVLERREGCVDDAVSLRVWSGLEASVSDAADIFEVELLSKIKAALVRGVGDVERESDVVHPVGGGSLELPIILNEGEDE